MGCIYSNNDGYCTMSSKGNPTQGCAEGEYSEEEEGYPCEVEDDPMPANNCETYESDYCCHECGADFNADEECTCG